MHTATRRPTKKTTSKTQKRSKSTLAQKKLVKKNVVKKTASAFKKTTPAKSFEFETSFGLNEEQVMFLETAKSFAASELEPFAQEWDQTKHFPIPTLKKAAELGFAALYVREDVGGMGLSRKDAAVIFEALATGCPAVTSYLTIHNMNSFMIDTFGTEEQRQKWCPKLATLDVFSSYCLTEPNAGSDAASLQTRAVKDGDNYVLNGSKAFISGGGVSDLYVVMARTGGPGAKGVSTFLVEKGTKGLTFGANEKKMGWNCSPTATVNFDDVVIPASNLLGGVEGEGFKFAMKGLDGGRVNISALSLGGAQAALKRSIEYTSQRKQFGKPLNENQWVQFTLADMTAQLTASRLMVHRAAEMIDAKHPQATIHAAMAKKFATEACSDVVDKALQLHGGYGYLQDFPLEKLSRDLRVHQILEGTNQIMQVITSRQLKA